MRRLIILLTIFFLGVNGFSQKKEKFSPGVKLVENTIISEIDSSSSILFIFQDHTHRINYYLDLTKRLKKLFRKSGEKIDFNYELSSTNPLEPDLNSIPKKTFHKADYDLICLISTSNFKSWDNHLGYKRKQNYKINLKFENNKTNELIKKIELNVNSYYTIATQNKNSSKLIYDLITD